MRVLIEIDCDTIQELTAHLTCMRDQVKKEMKKLKLNCDDEFPLGTELEDNNCYGTHELTIVPEAQ